MSKGVSKRKIDVLSLQLSQKENLKKCSNLKSRKVKLYSGKHLFWLYGLQLSFVYKSVSQISFNLLRSGDKRLL